MQGAVGVESAPTRIHVTEKPTAVSVDTFLLGIQQSTSENPA